jgi:transaldolase / glucose-6-phosphate isomerase
MRALDRIIDEDAVARLRLRDATLWAHDTNGIALAEASLGWTDLAECAEPVPEIRMRTLAELGDDITDIVLLGMGGSSLATLVMSRVLAGECSRRAHVFDTTSPHTIAMATAELDPAKTLYLVSSKSGGTIEPLTLYAIFRSVADEKLGREAAGDHFIAITDPGTALEPLAVADNFHAIFHGLPSVGGRFSALTAFGLAPALLLGIDTDKLIDRASHMELACSLPAAENPAALLAAFIADHAAAGRDKLTIVSSEPLESFGLWVEQLVAESLGKEGVGVIPVVELSHDLPRGYGPDRAIVVVRLEDDERLAQQVPQLSELAPTFDLVLGDVYDIGAEFVRWEHAIALLGFVIGINPFGQPNVAAAKAATDEVLAGTLHAPAPQICTPKGDELTFAGAFQARRRDDATVTAALGHALAALRDDDYLALLAYLPDDPELLEPLVHAVPQISSATGVAVTLELGPRYLHSTGQLHKGGPNTGVFVIITTRDHADIEVPGQQWTLRDLHFAQAEGDLCTLAAAGRRVLRVDLPDAGVETISTFASELVEAAESAG